MKVIGLIAEYNPFHNGHLYQIKTIKEMYPDSLIVLVTSTSFSQRGDLSLLNKWDKTSISLKNNVDIVLELPYFFSSQSSDIFAHATLKILNHFKIDTLIFGSESNNIEKLKTIANAQNNNECKKLLKQYLDEGYNYPTSLSKAISSISDEIVTEPNDLLGISYIKEIINNNYNIDIITIKRTNSYNDIESNNSIISASNIRNKFYKNIDYKNSVPKETFDILKNISINTSMYFDLLKYKIITEDINKYLDVSEGLDSRIKKYILKSENMDELIEFIKTKRYTRNRISRMLNHILIGLKKEDANNIKDITYIRLLGFNNNGKNYINRIKKEINIPLVHSFIKGDIVSNYELNSTIIYGMITNNSELINKEYRNTIIKFEN